jgi:hypothetical protein
MRMSQRLHSGQPGRSASSEKIEKAGFDLVVTVVGKQDSLAAIVLRACLEKGISQVACGCLEGEFFLSGVSPDVSFAQLEGIAQFLGGGIDEEGIGICRGAAHAVVAIGSSGVTRITHSSSL